MTAPSCDYPRRKGREAAKRQSASLTQSAIEAMRATKKKKKKKMPADQRKKKPKGQKEREEICLPATQKESSGREDRQTGRPVCKWQTEVPK